MRFIPFINFLCELFNFANELYISFLITFWILECKMMTVLSLFYLEIRVVI